MVSLTFVYTSADSSTEYGPSTPASRSSDSAWVMTSGISRGSSGRVSAGLELARADALDRRGVVALEDGPVLDERQLLGGVLDRIPVGVLRAALDVVDVVARQRERHPQPHQRFAVPQVGHHAVAGRRHVEQVAGADRRGDRAAGLADVDDPAAGDVPLERPRRLQFDFGPGGFGDRCQIAVQVVHWRVPFRLPIASEPFVCDGRR